MRAANETSAYARAGVDIAREARFVEGVKGLAQAATRPEVLSGVGGFAGLFEAPARYKNPVFAAATDGVGTKIKLALRFGRYETIGIDCVAMVVNDLIAQGAEPLVFLDYLASGELEEATANAVLRGVVTGCRQAGCALLGGETANMPGVMQKGELEIAGFGVGVLERDAVINGAGITPGMALIGCASAGVHANGFSLVRQIAAAGERAGKFNLRDTPPGFSAPLADALLAPTRIYVRPLLQLLREFSIAGVAHITGGGLPGNVPRVLPPEVAARINPDAWPRPAVFQFLQQHGEISADEMLQVFNCGVGLVLVLPREQTAACISRLQQLGEAAYCIGATEARGAQGAALIFDPEFNADAPL